MTFKFDVKVAEKDYMDYNLFWSLRSLYGKKQKKSIRIVITIAFVAFMIISSLNEEAIGGVISNVILYLIALGLIQALMNPIIFWAVKFTVKTLKKTGKMAYSPISTLEFNEDSFTESTPENKTEMKYSAIERISVVDNDKIYFHINNVASYILPLSCFESREQYDSFLGFIKTRCLIVDFYS